MNNTSTIQHFTNIHETIRASSHVHRRAAQTPQTRRGAKAISGHATEQSLARSFDGNRYVRAYVSIQNWMCSTQVVPKWRRVVHVEQHTTSVAICNALRAAAAHIHTIQRTTTRCKMVPDDRAGATNARPSVLHAGLCMVAKHQPCTRVPPSEDPLFMMKTNPLLHCLVSL